LTITTEHDKIFKSQKFFLKLSKKKVLTGRVECDKIESVVVIGEPEVL